MEELNTRLVKVRTSSRPETTLAQLARPKVLILDELGYQPFSQEDASSLLRLLVKQIIRGEAVRGGKSEVVRRE